MMNLLVKTFCILFLVSCGKDGGVPGSNNEKALFSNPAQAEKYSYEFSSNKCSTGKHEFETVKLACEALTDDELNNNCASSHREQLYFNTNCSSLI